MYQRFLVIIVLFALLLAGCKKQGSDFKCQELKEAIVTDNVEAVKTKLTGFINKLTSNTYSKQNLEILVASLSRDCSISAELLCFDCIYTLPPQSEIRVIFNSSGSVISKTIDLSYSPDNKIKVVNMHD